MQLSTPHSKHTHTPTRFACLFIPEPHTDKTSCLTTHAPPPPALQVGRAVLPIQHQAPSSTTPPGLGCFTPTGLALRLMERIGVCLSRAEPVLLVGETGTGKTTTLTQLARLSGANLVALNMSQQTDSSDLLGGFKPVGVGEALLPLLEPFGELLRRTWKRWVGGLWGGGVEGVCVCGGGGGCEKALSWGEGRGQPSCQPTVLSTSGYCVCMACICIA
jgi:hypothetical protein